MKKIFEFFKIKYAECSLFKLHNLNLSFIIKEVNTFLFEKDRALKKRKFNLTNSYFYFRDCFNFTFV